MAKALLWQTILGLSSLGLCFGATDDDLVGRFTQPPSDTRILKIVHSWPDAPAEQERWIRGLTNQSFGGVVCNVSFSDYLRSAAKWQAFTGAVHSARAAGMALWLYDERGYPSAAAGGLVLQDHPEWQAEGLLVADAETSGGRATIEAPPGRWVLAHAYPLKEDAQDDLAVDPGAVVDLSARVRDGRLEWEAPAGRWRVLVITKDKLFEGTHAALNLHEKLPYPNLLMAEPTKRFLDLTHERYAQHLGPDLGKHFMATFTDEPSLMSLFLRPMPYRVLPWAPGFSATFKQRRGYGIEPHIPELALNSSTSKRHRHDFWLTVGELVSENFFGQIQDRCRRLHIPSGGHLLMEEGIAAHVALYGDFFRCLRRMDAPSIDCLTSLPQEVPWYIARMAASAAELENKTLVMSETSDHSQRYRPAGDSRPMRTVTEAEIRGTCNRLFVGGVNCITSYYSFADLSEEQLRHLNQYVGRCCGLLRGGHQVTEVAVVYPAETLWTQTTPSRHMTHEAPDAARTEAVFRGTLDALYGARRDFTIVDARSLIEARVENGALVHGNLRWRVAILPGVDTLPWRAWNNLAQLVRSGGVVVALGAAPANSESEFPSTQVAALAAELFGATSKEGASDAEKAGQPRSKVHPSGGAGFYLPRGSESLVSTLLGRVLSSDLEVRAAEAPIRYTHRRLEGAETYFVINDSPNPWKGELRFAAKGRGKQYDPLSGKVAHDVDPEHAAVGLDGFGAACFRFAEPVRQRLTTAVPGTLPWLRFTDLALHPPTVGRGQYVREKLETVELPGKRDGGQARGLRAQGTLTRSGVDTFLFLCWGAGTTALDLRRADCLSVETWAPSGQRTSSQLLVILREKGGGDFLATTGRSLGVSGPERTCLPWSRFQLAGWSTDADGMLDLAQVQEIRVGWGGYYGKEGEAVEFTVGPPQVGLVSQE